MWLFLLKDANYLAHIILLVYSTFISPWFQSPLARQSANPPFLLSQDMHGFYKPAEVSVQGEWVQSPFFFIWDTCFTYSDIIFGFPDASLTFYFPNGSFTLSFGKRCLNLFSSSFSSCLWDMVTHGNAVQYWHLPIRVWRALCNLPASPHDLTLLQGGKFYWFRQQLKETWRNNGVFCPLLP